MAEVYLGVDGRNDMHFVLYRGRNEVKDQLSNATFVVRDQTSKGYIAEAESLNLPFLSTNGPPCQERLMTSIVCLSVDGRP